MKLYVGNLPYYLNESELCCLFTSLCSVLNVQLVFDEMGRSRGFGFIEVEGKWEAAKAIESLNGAAIGGQEIKVDEANSQARRDFSSYKQKAM